MISILQCTTTLDKYFDKKQLIFSFLQLIQKQILPKCKSRFPTSVKSFYIIIIIIVSYTHKTKRGKLDMMKCVGCKPFRKQTRYYNFYHFNCKKKFFRWCVTYEINCIWGDRSTMAILYENTRMSFFVKWVKLQSYFFCCNWEYDTYVWGRSQEILVEKQVVGLCWNVEIFKWKVTKSIWMWMADI